MENIVQRFETGISENNLKHWGELEMVKEFLQNAVYAKTILGDKVELKYVDGLALIHNYPSGFTKGKLLVGESEQADVAGAPGQYGEGMKAAMAVAKRLGKQCIVATNGFTVAPQLLPSTLDPSVRTLIFDITDTDMNKGTCFTVECSEEVFEEAKKSFAVLQGHAPEVVSKDSIIRGLEESGDIYVNGVRVYKTNAVLSYNFTDTKMMNRDRSSVDMVHVKRFVKPLLAGISEIGLAMRIIKAILRDDTLLEAQAAPSHDGKNIWKDAFSQIYNGKRKFAISSNSEDDTQASYRQYKVLSLPSDWQYFCNHELGFPYTDDLAKAAKKTSRVHRKPAPELSQNIGWAKRLVKLYYGDYGTVKIAEDLHDEHDCKCYGLYDSATDVIWLDKSILDHKEMLFTTLLHETIHRVSGAKDNTSAFTAQWEKACWGILTKGKGHM